MCTFVYFCVSVLVCIFVRVCVSECVRVCVPVRASSERQSALTDPTDDAAVSDALTKCNATIMVRCLAMARVICLSDHSRCSRAAHLQGRLRSQEPAERIVAVRAAAVLLASASTLPRRRAQIAAALQLLTDPSACTVRARHSTSCAARPQALHISLTRCATGPARPHRLRARNNHRRNHHPLRNQDLLQNLPRHAPPVRR